MLSPPVDSQSDILHVLVVDDDEAVRHLISTILTREGHVPMVASSAEEALELLPRWTFQVAFVDHHLPGMEGVLFGQYLRRNNPEMQIALVTGDDTKRLERQSRELRITFIRKPFDVKDILRVLEDHAAAVAERTERAADAAQPDFDPAFARYYMDLSECFSIPSTPRRIQEILVEGIKQRLNALRSGRHYDERDRVAALAGLIAAQVLGVDLPKTSEGKTLFEEYDAAMQRHGRRVEFAGSQ
jgi:CheY-like chemotaxis protein